MYWFLFGLLIAALAGLVIAYVVMGRKEREEISESEDLADLQVTQARLGDNILVPGLGQDFQDLSFTVDRKHRYERGGESWYELSGRAQGKRVYLEVTEDDEVETTVAYEHEKLVLSDLGLTEKDLERMDDRHDTSESFEHDGAKWRFDSSGEIGYFKNDGDQGEGYYSWNFREVDGRRAISVEKWEGDPFEVRVATIVNPDDVRVFRG